MHKEDKNHKQKRCNTKSQGEPCARQCCHVQRPDPLWAWRWCFLAKRLRADQLLGLHGYGSQYPVWLDDELELVFERLLVIHPVHTPVAMVVYNFLVRFWTFKQVAFVHRVGLHGAHQISFKACRILCPTASSLTEPWRPSLVWTRRPAKISNTLALAPFGVRPFLTCLKCS